MAFGAGPDGLAYPSWERNSQLDEEREALRRADTIIAKLARANEEQTRTIREPG
jgi:hypothetical protein